MRIMKFKTTEEALNQLIKRNKKYVIIRHELEQNEEIKEHSHDVDEFVIFKDGFFEVNLEKDSKQFNLQNEIIAFHFPKNSRHYLKNIGKKLNYYVVRNFIENNK